MLAYHGACIYAAKLLRQQAQADGEALYFVSRAPPPSPPPPPPPDPRSHARRPTAP